MLGKISRICTLVVYRTFDNSKNPVACFGSGSERFSQFVAPHGEDITQFSEKSPDRLLGIGNNRIHLLLIQYFLHGTSVRFHRFSLVN